MTKQTTAKLFCALLLALTALPAVAYAEQAPTLTKPPARTKSDGVRTLDAIRIEGEIAVPQVLFISGRDYPRFRDGLGARLRPRSVDIARAMQIPTRVRVVTDSQSLVSRHKEE